MKVIDLSQTIEASMPVFPGTKPPILAQANTLEKDGFMEKEITMYSHTGTHLDVPAHIFKDGLTLDQMEAAHFYGNAFIIDVTNNSGGTIHKQDLQSYEHLFAPADFVILKTGWSRFWGTDEYYQGFPSLTIEAAKWLTGYKLKGIGIDTISIDDMNSNAFEIHKVFLGKKIIVIENLTNLDAVRDDRFLFSCLPLKIKTGDGSPVRAVAILG